MNKEEMIKCQQNLDRLGSIPFSSDFDARNKEMFHLAYLRCQELSNKLDSMRSILPNDLIEDYKYATEEIYRLLIWIMEPITYETVKAFKNRLER